MSDIVQVDGKAISKARKQKGLSQARLAEAINVCDKTIWTIEKHGRTQWARLTEIAEELGVSSFLLMAKKELPWSVPQPTWTTGINSPGMLLTAEMSLVPFQLRNEQLTSLESWCNGRDPLKIGICVNRGGMGKTRIALELSRSQAKNRWQVGFWDPELLNRDSGIYESALVQSDPLLVVVDYAEARHKDIAWLLGEILRLRQSMRTRLLLLARKRGDWLVQLESDRICADVFAAGLTTHFDLPDLTASVDARVGFFRQAQLAFAMKLGVPEPPKVKVDLSDAHYGVPLLIQLQALASLYEEKPKGEDAIIRFMLGRERRFWRERREARELDSSLDVALEEAVATIALKGGVRTPEEGYALLVHLPSLAGRPADVCIALNNLLSECYPGDAVWIEPLQPDILAENLVKSVIGKNVDPNHSALSAVRAASKKRSVGA